MNLIYANLENHLGVCQRLYEFILEENRFLKERGQPLDSCALEKKRALLSELNDSLFQLRAQPGKVSEASAKALLERATQLILKTLLVDRENEQLLLKATFAPAAAMGETKAGAAQVRSVYLRGV